MKNTKTILTASSCTTSCSSCGWLISCSCSFPYTRQCNYASFVCLPLVHAYSFREACNLVLSPRKCAQHLLQDTSSDLRTAAQQPVHHWKTTIQQFVIKKRAAEIIHNYSIHLVNHVSVVDIQAQSAFLGAIPILVILLNFQFPPVRSNTKLEAHPWYVCPLTACSCISLCEMPSHPRQQILRWYSFSAIRTKH